MPSEHGILPFTSALSDILTCPATLPIAVLWAIQNQEDLESFQSLLFCSSWEPAVSFLCELYTGWFLVCFRVLFIADRDDWNSHKALLRLLSLYTGGFLMQHLSHPLVSGVNTWLKTHFKRMLTKQGVAVNIFSQKGTAGCSRTCSLHHVQYFIMFRIRMYKSIKNHQSAHKCGD